MSMLATKLHTSSTVQLDRSSWSRGLSDSARFGVAVAPGLAVEGLFIRVLFNGGAAAERSRGDERSVRLAFFSKLCSSASFAVRTIARRVLLEDMSIRGWNIGFANGLRSEVKSGGFLFVSSLVGVV